MRVIQEGYFSYITYLYGQIYIMWGCLMLTLYFNQFVL
ncbi:hypothetical protein ABID22_003562 [Pontibacter aydingkolensis]